MMFRRFLFTLIVVASLFGRLSALPTYAEVPRELGESSTKQATYHVVINAIGYSVDNQIHISVGGVSVVDRHWGGGAGGGFGDDSQTVDMYTASPGVGISIDHMAGSILCRGGAWVCVEDAGDGDYDDLVYLITTTLVDNTPPITTHSLAGTLGSNGWYTTNVVVTLSATDNVGVASTTMDGSSYTAARTISTEGTTSHTYFSVDSAGNTETTKTFDLKVDKTAPSAAISSHTASQPVRATISLGGTTSDATSGLASVQVSTDGGTTWNSATIVSGNWSYSLNTTTLTDGTRAIQVRATDNAGNQTTTSLSLLVDNTIPASTFVSTPTDNGWYAGSVTFSGTSSDATSGVASLQQRTDSGGWSTLSGTTTWSFTVDTTTLSDGQHTFYVTATDAAGNLESTAVKTINIGNVPPISSLEATCPAPGSNGWCKAPINVVVSASSTAPIQSVSYWIDGNSESTSQGTTTFGVTGGVHSASTYATSILGKRSNTVTKGDLKVDGAPPTIEFRGATQTALVFRISDGESGVGSWTLQVFNGQGQSVFYKDGTGEFNGDLGWSPNRGASSGVGKLFSVLPQSNQFKVNIFARDNAGHENGVQQAQFTLNVIATPLPTFTPTSTPRKVVALPVVVNTGTARPSGTPLPTTTFTPIPTATGIRVVALPPAQPPAIKHPSRVISGVVFRDRNGNGVQDDGEDGVSAVPIEIVTSITGERVRFTTTSSGIYIVVVAGGNNLQVVRVIVPNGLFPTWGSEQTITSGENVVVNFGLQGMSLGLWLLLIGLVACLVWLVSETATLDRRAEAILSLGEQIDAVFSARLQSAAIENARVENSLRKDS